MVVDAFELMDLGPRARATDPAAVAAEERAKRRDLPDQNEALRAWATEAPVGASPRQASGTCAHGDERNAKYVCNQCGRGACAGHFWVMFGLCRACASEERVRKWHDEARPEDRNWLDDT